MVTAVYTIPFPQVHYHMWYFSYWKAGQSLPLPTDHPYTDGHHDQPMVRVDTKEGLGDTSIHSPVVETAVDA